MIPPLNHYSVAQIVHAFGSGRWALLIIAVVFSVVFFVIGAAVNEASVRQRDNIGIGSDGRRRLAQDA
ncbi:MAG: hypothetical protein C7B45_07030 [Sulfobacillus acidophilus]|uniref:ABC transporter permease n=1 Tax=Sulfobacillus acidophilus TaxID=53633 RepID=A0A2T2WJE2_9FIRM|nr:MAG: hypothetical protein C7B45_07030 [Sulfobacillus acidophilus]